MRGECAPKRLDPMGIGRMITTKVNANIGASPVTSSLDQEIEKLRFAQRYGADTLMDLSTGGTLAETRQALIDNSTIPIGTVPIYAMIFGRRIEDLSYDDHTAGNRISGASGCRLLHDPRRNSPRPS